MLKDYIDLLLSRVVYDFEQADDIRVSSLFEDGNFALNLVLVTGVLAQTATLGVTVDDLDGDVLPSVQVLPELDLTMHTASKLIDDLVLIDELATRDGVVGHVGDVALLRCLSVGMVKPRA